MSHFKKISSQCFCNEKKIVWLRKIIPQLLSHHLVFERLWEALEKIGRAGEMIAVQLISHGIEDTPMSYSSRYKVLLAGNSSYCIEMLIESNSSENWKDIGEVWP